mmetsp:Transcript_23250/g.32453  ORF Transcript_23250/g.32453 Transcript_23250/m.32453 type:complete len:119 (+) Transcript_23250:2-358(+)
MMGKSKRELKLGKLHLYTKRLGNHKAKHGKVPYSSIVSVEPAIKRSPKHFEINFSGPSVNGKRIYEAETASEAKVLVQKLTILVRQARAAVEILGEDALSPPSASEITPEKLFSFGER